MARLIYPELLLQFTSLMWQVREVSRSGGPSVLGSEQIVQSPAGRWSASLTLSVGSMAWNGSEELLVFRGFMAQLRGRSGVVDLPYFDGRGPGQLLGLETAARHSDGVTFSDGTTYRQGSVPVTLAAAAQMNDTVVTVAFPEDVQPIPGQCFTMPDGWMHQVGDLLAVDGQNWTVLVSPWLRADYAAASALEVDVPTSRMRLVGDDSGAAQIQAGQGWVNPTLEFIEAF